MEIKDIKEEIKNDKWGYGVLIGPYSSQVVKEENKNELMNSKNYLIYVKSSGYYDGKVRMLIDKSIVDDDLHYFKEKGNEEVNILSNKVRDYPIIFLKSGLSYSTFYETYYSKEYTDIIKQINCYSDSSSLEDYLDKLFEISEDCKIPIEKLLVSWENTLQLNHNGYKVEVNNQEITYYDEKGNKFQEYFI